MMWFRVAALLGSTVEELQQRMTGEEFRDWCAFYALEPWGSEVDNWRMGVLAATTANFSGRSKKSLKPSDFMPRAAARKRKMTPAEIRAGLRISTRQGHDNEA